MVKAYWTLWLIVAVAAAIFLLAGAMTTSTVIVFGVISFGMTFMGMMNVLPAMVSHPEPRKEEVEKPEKTAAVAGRSGIGHRARSAHV